MVYDQRAREVRRVSLFQSESHADPEEEDQAAAAAAAAESSERGSECSQIEMQRSSAEVRALPFKLAAAEADKFARVSRSINSSRVCIPTGSHDRSDLHRLFACDLTAFSFSLVCLYTVYCTGIYIHVYLDV